MDSGVCLECFQKSHSAIKRNWKICLKTGLEVLQDVARGENIKTEAKKRPKQTSLVLSDDTVSRMVPKKSIKDSTNKQITVNSAKSKDSKH